MQSQSCVDLYTDETRTTSRASTSHLSHPPRATTSERSFRPRRVEPSVTDTDPVVRVPVCSLLRAVHAVPVDILAVARSGPFRHPCELRVCREQPQSHHPTRTASIWQPPASQPRWTANPPLFHSGEPPPLHREQGAFPPQQGASPPCFTAGVFAPQQGASPPSLHPRGSARNTAT